MLHRRYMGQRGDISRCCQIPHVYMGSTFDFTVAILHLYIIIDRLKYAQLQLAEFRTQGAVPISRRSLGCIMFKVSTMRNAPRVPRA